MKKSILIIGLLFFAFGQMFVQAQSFEILNEDDEVISGTTVHVSGDINDEMVFDFKVSNTTALSVTTKLERIIENETGSPSTTFCVNGQCVMPGNSTSGEFLINPSYTLDGFSIHYNAEGSTGASTYRYKVYNVNNATDFIDFTIIFDATTSINDLSTGLKLAEIYPNPANKSVNIEFVKIGMQVVVYNLLGEQVAQYVSRDSMLELNCSDWDEGIYILRIFDDKQLTQTSKIVVSH